MRDAKRRKTSPKPKANSNGALDKNEFGGRLRQIREERGETQSAAAFRLKVGLKTIQNWESGKIVPSAEKVAQIARDFEVEVTRFYPVPVSVESIKDITHIVTCQEECARVWILKTGRPFVSAEDSELREKMIGLMRDKAVEYYFVCPGDGSRSQRAYMSHQRFVAEARGHKDYKAVEKHAHCVEIPDETVACALGLVDEWMSFVCAEYSEQGIRNRKRVLDVWVEFAKDLDVEGIRKVWFWVELSKNEAVAWWERRSKILHDLVNSPAAPAG